MMIMETLAKRRLFTVSRPAETSYTYNLSIVRNGVRGDALELLTSLLFSLPSEWLVIYPNGGGAYPAFTHVLTPVSQIYICENPVKYGRDWEDERRVTFANSASQLYWVVEDKDGGWTGEFRSTCGKTAQIRECGKGDGQYGLWGVAWSRQVEADDGRGSGLENCAERGRGGVVDVCTTGPRKIKRHSALRSQAVSSGPGHMRPSSVGRAARKEDIECCLPTKVRVDVDGAERRMGEEIPRDAERGEVNGNDPCAPEGEMMHAEEAPDERSKESIQTKRRTGEEIFRGINESGREM
ncbi:hypothetical protein C8R44DRAFT_733000 [Mycena epipterygia]|nr:hypothetical protein C8R44DRAFT_733000 [Mycena epipterygia]